MNTPSNTFRSWKASGGSRHSTTASSSVNSTNAGHWRPPRRRHSNRLRQKRSSCGIRTQSSLRQTMSRTATDELWVARLGQVPYAEAVAIQERLRAARQAGELPDVLLLLEHPPVYTLGRRGDETDLPMGESWYLSQGIDVQRSDRGGRLTYHGPGQLVGYPIMQVGDVPGLRARPGGGDGRRAGRRGRRRRACATA